jgi:pimeloyl-ACP methyl ester carboxylesterase
MPQRRARRRLALVAPVLATSVLVAACTDESTPQETAVNAPSTHSTEPAPAQHARTVDAAGTTFAVDVRGDGPPILVIHGGGEDGRMLTPLAEALAAAGREVITYDRRGTGRSGRDQWPGEGATQHGDDAAALLQALDIDRAEVVGLSSGGVVALDLAARHPSLVDHVFVWEAPALGVLEGGGQMNAAIMAPVDEHLAAHPGDFVGAQAILLTAIVGFPVTVDDPLFAEARANAEPMIRDEPTITLRPFDDDDLASTPATIAVGTAPNDVVAAAATALAARTGTSPLVIDTPEHEVYLSDPDVLVDAIVDRR